MEHQVDISKMTKEERAEYSKIVALRIAKEHEALFRGLATYEGNERIIESRLSLLKNELKHAMFDVMMSIVWLVIGSMSAFSGHKIVGAMCFVVCISFLISFYKWLLK